MQQLLVPKTNKSNLLYEKLYQDDICAELDNFQAPHHSQRKGRGCLLQRNMPAWLRQINFVQSKGIRVLIF